MAALLRRVGQLGRRSEALFGGFSTKLEAILAHGATVTGSGFSILFFFLRVGLVSHRGDLLTPNEEENQPPPSARPGKLPLGATFERGIECVPRNRTCDLGIWASLGDRPIRGC